MNPRPVSRLRRRGWTSRRAGLVFLAVLFSVLSAPPSRRLPLAIESKLESLRRPHDSPDLAQAYAAAKRRFEDGASTDLFHRYRVARQRMSKMARHSTRLNRRLASKSRHGRLSLRGAAREAEWAPLGPGNIGGRTRALLVHPQNPSIIWAAGVSGGVWKSLDGGDSWRPLDDFLPNIAVSSMVMDPADPDVIYAGTGEGQFREIIRGTGLPLRGGGIFRTKDGGESWSRLQATEGEDFHWVNDLDISLHDSDRLYAATRSGVWRSTDAGDSWKRVLDPQVMGGCYYLAQFPDSDTDSFLASCGTFAVATVYRNTAAEGVAVWQPVLSEAGMGLTSLAVAPSQPQTVYALSASIVAGPMGRYNGGLHAVFRSDQGGAAGSWTARVRNTDAKLLNTLILTNPIIANLAPCFGGNDRFSTLGWYTNVIAVDPTDPDVLWAGGIDLFRSDDGGRNWGPVSYWWASPPSSHADQHVLVFHPDYDGQDNQTLFVGGDGGVFRSDNARAARSMASDAVCDPGNTQVSWTSLSHGYGVTQFYHGAPFPDGERYLGGAQDNGTLLGTDAGGIDSWSNILGGDGGYVAVDPQNPNFVYAESQGLALARSTDGGATFQSATSGITESRFNFLFITPFVMDPSEPRRLWIGGRQMWRTNDRAVSWQEASSPFSFAARISAIAVSPVDSNRVLAATEQGFIHRRDDALSSGASSPWLGVRPRGGFVSWLAFDPQDALTAYAAYAGFGGGAHLWKTQDGGSSWTPIDGQGQDGLPDIPVHSILVDPGDPQRIYLGTDLGVLVTTEGGHRWQVELTGFPNTVTESLSLLEKADGTRWLYAFTHGRGAWRVPLSAPASCDPDRWITHVVPEGLGFSTTLLMTNFSDQTEQVELVPYQADGVPFDPVQLEVEPGATVARQAGELFPGKSVSHLGICGNFSVSVTAAYRNQSSGGPSAHVPETSRTHQRVVSYPGERGIVFDGMAVVNTGEESARVTAVQLDGDGAELRRVELTDDLAPQAKLLAVFEAVFQNSQGSAILLESDQPLALLILRGTFPNDGPQVLAQIVPGSSFATAPTGPPERCPGRFILHVTPAEAPFATTLFVTELSQEGGSVQLVPYLQDGTALPMIEIDLSEAPLRSVIVDAGQFFEGMAGAPASHFGVCGGQTTPLTVSYRVTSILGASAHVTSAAPVGGPVLYYPGEWDIVFEGLSVVNSGAEPVRVEAVLLDAAGDEVHRAVLVEGLAPQAKHLAVLDAVFQGFSGTAIRIESDGSIETLILRGTRPEAEPMLLYQVLPLSVNVRR